MHIGVGTLTMAAAGAAVAGGVPPASAVTPAEYAVIQARLSAVDVTSDRRHASASTRPNIIMFLTDDMNANELQYLPNVQRVLVDRGTSFTTALAPNSLCCPARATLSTGQYSHNHGVMGNEPDQHGGWAIARHLNQRNLLPTWLQQTGYRTWHSGKHFNGFRLTEPQPGWDFWSATTHGIYNYENFGVAVQGRLVPHTNEYQELVVRHQMLRGIERMAPRSRPFFMWVGSLAPHGHLGGPPHPEPKYKGAFADFTFPLSPAIGETNISDKPPWVTLEKNAMTPSKAQLATQARVEALMSVDDTIGAAARKLKATGDFRNTVFIFLSDNGFLLGEHRHHGKNVPYEEAIRVPLVIAGPGFAPGTHFGRVVSQADVTATILDIANAKSGLTPDGLSLRGPGRTKRIGRYRVVPIEGGTWQVPAAVAGQTDRLHRFYWGARWSHYMYVQYKPGFREFYDLRTDPYELDNGYRPSAGSPVQRAMETWVRRHKNCAGRGCNQPLDLSPQP